MNRSALKSFIIPGLFLGLVLPASAFATIGVGIGSGKIVVQEPILPGGIYTIPSVPVLNTGDERSEYDMDVEYLQGQQQLEPPESWFSFDPERFTLDPQKTQVVKITLMPSVNARPGDYFAYIETHPIIADKEGVSRVGIAAAAKIYFTVAPANVFQGIYYRVLAFLNRYAPWDYVAFAVVGVVVLFTFLSRFFSFNLGISVRKKGK